MADDTVASTLGGNGQMALNAEDTKEFTGNLHVAEEAELWAKYPVAASLVGKEK